MIANASAISLVSGDKILLAGGARGPQLASGYFPALDSIEIYDPATGQATITGHMSQERIAAAAVSLADGRILVVGGAGGVGAAAIATADLIDPVTGQASAPVKLVGPRYHAAAILLPDHRALIAGGDDARRPHPEDRGGVRALRENWSPLGSQRAPASERGRILSDAPQDTRLSRTKNSESRARIVSGSC